MPQTLLLADDSVTIQRVIELTFADQDISVIAVGNGDQAVASIRHSPPDIVLADVGMPGRSGYEVARYIKQTPSLAHIPVLLLTGAFEPVDQARALEVGCDGVLTKPFEPQFVIERVRELLEASRPAAVSPIVDTVAFQPPPASTETAARLDDYFERLDQAFAARTIEPAIVMTEAAPHPVVPERDLAPLAAALEAPVGSGEPALAGAFSALLAAEQSGSAMSAFSDWLPDEAELDVPSARTPVITDDVIEAIVLRVLERLSDTVVRAAVAAVASATAERLVREEIDRIKSNIK